MSFENWEYTHTTNTSHIQIWSSSLQCLLGYLQLMCISAVHVLDSKCENLHWRYSRFSVCDNKGIYLHYYHTSNLYPNVQESVVEALAHAVNKIILKSCENLNQVTKSHVIYIRYCKSHAPCLNM